MSFQLVVADHGTESRMKIDDISLDGLAYQNNGSNEKFVWRALKP